MSAPTLWEEGHLSGSRVTRLAATACALLTLLSILITGGLGIVFAVGFVAICVGAALLVSPRDFFRVGVLPPLLLLATVVIVSTVHRSAIGAPHDGFIQGVVSGLANAAAGLFAGYALALAVLALRHRVLSRRTTVAADVADYSNREASPAPTLVTSAAPEEKSTTVVGDEPHSPESITASNL